MGKIISVYPTVPKLVGTIDGPPVYARIHRTCKILFSVPYFLLAHSLSIAIIGKNFASFEKPECSLRSRIVKQRVTRLQCMCD